MRVDTLNRVALVTGANRGIGKEICRQLATLGVQVILTARDTVDGQKTVGEISGKENILPPVLITIDVSNAKSIADAADEVSDRFNRLDVLVNNAGILIAEHKDLLTIDPQLIQKTPDTNLFGPIMTIRRLFR